MANEVFTAACGCIWHGQEHYPKCVLWRRLAARLELLQALSGADQEIQKIKDQLDHHRRA
jgi:hypothetical protein